MSEYGIISRIDYQDPRCQAALAAERSIFAHYGVDYRSHIIEMEEPALRLRVLEAGEGPPLMLVPGGSGDAVFLVPLMARLTGWRVIAINRPGGGMSDGIDHRRVDLRRLAVDTLRTVADAFDLSQGPIVANSMGGLWSFWYALAYPERVTRMVQLGCPALILDTSAPFFMRLLGAPLIGRAIGRQMQPGSAAGALDGLRFQGSSPDDIARLPAAAAEVAYRFFNLPTYLSTWRTLVGAVTTLSGARAEYRLEADQLRQVQPPVQLIWGDRDPFGDLEVARYVVKLLPRAQLHEMQAGHLPFLDKPEETADLIQSFLNAVAEPGIERFAGAV